MQKLVRLHLSENIRGFAMRGEKSPLPRLGSEIPEKQMIQGKAHLPI